MKIIKKIFLSAVICLQLVNLTSAASLLPSFDDPSLEGFDMSELKEASAEECRDFYKEVVDFVGGEESLEAYLIEEPAFREAVLACAIKSGDIEFWMLKHYITRALSFLIGLAGVIAILMIIIGAYYYIAGGISDDKEKGKTIIKYAIGGLILTSLAWILVNFLLLLITA